MLAWLLVHGSLALLFALLVAGGLGVPFPEDLVLLTAGVLVHRGVVPLPYALALCMFGVLLGDFLLFNTARRLGPAALDRPMFGRLLPPQRRRRIADVLKRHGSLIIFVARHLAGLRAPVFAMAGMHGMSPLRFIVVDALALCISAPLVVGLGYLFSQNIELARRGMASVEHFIVIAAVLILLGYLLVITWRRWRNRRGRREAPPKR